MNTVLVAPRLSAALLLTWLLLSGSLAPGQLLLGIVVALAIPFFLGQRAAPALRVGAGFVAGAAVHRSSQWDNHADPRKPLGRRNP